MGNHSFFNGVGKSFGMGKLSPKPYTDTARGERFPIAKIQCKIEKSKAFDFSSFFGIIFFSIFAVRSFLRPILFDKKSPLCYDYVMFLRR